jgi:hypothetical protein
MVVRATIQRSALFRPFPRRNRPTQRRARGLAKADDEQPLRVLVELVRKENLTRVRSRSHQETLDGELARVFALNN